MTLNELLDRARDLGRAEQKLEAEEDDLRELRQRAAGGAWVIGTYDAERRVKIALQVVQDQTRYLADAVEKYRDAAEDIAKTIAVYAEHYALNPSLASFCESLVDEIRIKWGKQ